MKKPLLILSFLPLFLLTSCNGEPGQTTQTSQSEQSGKPVLPVDENFAEFTTMSELFGYLNGSARFFEAKHASSFERTLYSYEQGMFQIKEETTTEKGNAYSNKVSTISGAIETKKHGDPDGLLPDTTETHSYQSYAEFSDAKNTYYAIYDFDEGKKNDKATREEYQASHAQTYVLTTGANTITSAVEYYELYLKPTIVAGFDSISPVINTKEGTVTYRIEDTRTESFTSGSYQFSVAFDFVFAEGGALLEHGFHLLEVNTSNPNLPIKTTEIKDHYKLGYASKDAYNGGFLNPLDYFMTDYEIGLVARNTYDDDIHNVDPTQFPFDYYVVAEAKTCVPEKAVDTKLIIIDSTNQKVIERIDYASGTSNFRAVGEGTTTLTVRSETGIEKKIEVSVKAPAMESIEIKAFSKVNYVGEETGLYIFTHPDNTNDGYEVKALTPEIASLKKDDRGYYSGVNLKEGIAKFEVVSTTNPAVRSEVSYQITTRLDQQAVLDKFYKSTFTGDLPHENGVDKVKDAVTVQIKGEGQATFTFNSEEIGHWFKKGQPYDVTYQMNTVNKYTHFVEFWFSPIETASPSGTKFIYDNIVARFYMNGRDYAFQIAIKDQTQFHIDPLVFEGQLAA